MSKATLDILGELHGKLARNMIELIDAEKPVMVMSEQGPVPTGRMERVATNGDWNAIAKFLKDNAVTADISSNKGLGELDRKLKASARRSDNVLDLPVPRLAAGGNQ